LSKSLEKIKAKVSKLLLSDRGWDNGRHRPEIVTKRATPVCGKSKAARRKAAKIGANANHLAQSKGHPQAEADRTLGGKACVGGGAWANCPSYLVLARVLTLVRRSLRRIPLLFDKTLPPEALPAAGAPSGGISP
jgi:hypothetical protein